MKEQNFKSLPFKDKLAYITCIASFILGWCITIAGFVVSPLGEVSDSVLFILGQSLIYCASVLGLSIYVTKSVRGMRRELGLPNEIREDEYNE